MTTRPRVSFLLVAALAVGTISAEARQTPRRDSALAGTTPVEATGTIGGRVLIAGQPARPARGALVTLSGGTSANGQVTVTDAEGRFTFAALAPSRYTVSVAKAPYVAAFFGSVRPGRGPGTPIALAAGQVVNDITMTMLPGAVIAGATLDEQSRPRSLSTVVVLDATTLRPDGSARAVATTRSDATGHYRVAGLPPGRYLVAVQLVLSFHGARVPQPEEFAEPARAVALGSAVNYAPTLFPSATDPHEAAVVSLSAGEARDGIDVTMRLVPSAHVMGRVVGPDGAAPKSLQLSMISPSARMGFEDRVIAGNVRAVGVVPAKADGTFDQPALPPGHYNYFARAIDPAAADQKTATPTLWASVDFDADGHDVTDLVIHLQPGVTVAGRLAPDIGRTAPDWSSAKLSLEPTDDGPQLAVAPATVASDGSFSFKGVAPGTYDVVSTGLAGWVPKAVVVPGEDVGATHVTVAAGQSISDVVVTMTDQAPSIVGRLVDVVGRPAPEYDIVVLPADRSAWTARRVRSVRPATDGRYIVSGLIAGDYLVAAVTDVSPSDLADPSFLEVVASSAIRVGVALGDVKTVDLRIAGRDR